MLKKVVGFVMALMVMLPVMASAHAELVSSNPKEGSTVKGSISSVKMNFGEEVKDFNSMTIKDSKGNSYSVSKYEINGKHVILHLSKPLTDGQYTFEWKVLSQDGHVAPGELQFGVGKKSDATTTQQTSNSDVKQKKTTNSPVIPIVIIVLIVVVLTGAFSVLKRKK